MLKSRTELKEIGIIEDIVCNKCGNSCKVVDCENYFSCAELVVHWGYGSGHDGEVHEAHLCEQCWEQIIKDFKYSDLVAENQL